MKPEILDTSESSRVLDTAGGHFMIAASVIRKQLGKLRLQPSPDHKYKIEFTVNGVRLPFIPTITEIYDRYEKDIDQRAAKRALEMIELMGLSDLIEAVKQSEWAIKEALKKKFGKDIFGNED